VQGRDLDNVILITGDPGSGKSTLMFQLGRVFSPRFDRERIHFTLDDYMEDAKRLPAGSAVAWDEAFISGANATTKDMRRLRDFLQVCRGLNLHHVLCFPWAHRATSAIIDDRIRWRIDIDEPETEEQEWRLAHVKERRVLRYHNMKGEEEMVVQWPEVMPLRFVGNRGPLWEEYLAKKLSSARARDGVSGDSTDPLAPLPADAPAPHGPRPKQGRVLRGRPISARVKPTSPLYPTQAPALTTDAL